MVVVFCYTDSHKLRKYKKFFIYNYYEYCANNSIIKTSKNVGK